MSLIRWIARSIFRLGRWIVIGHADCLIMNHGGNGMDQHGRLCVENLGRRLWEFRSQVIEPSSLAWARTVVFCLSKIERETEEKD